VIRPLGNSEVKLDAKGRFMLPARYREVLGDSVRDGFVLKRSIFKKCLELFTLENWEHESAMINKLNMFKKKNSVFATQFMAGVRVVELDNAGRLLIPKDLLQYGGLKKQLVLTETNKRIEIWDKDEYEKFIADERDNFGALAEEVMSDLDQE
jgi:MraZ protein